MIKDISNLDIPKRLIYASIGFILPIVLVITVTIGLIFVPNIDKETLQGILVGTSLLIAGCVLGGILAIAGDT